MSRSKKIFTMLLTAVMALALTALIGQKSAQAASGGKVTVSVERFSLGQGYLIEPEQITFNAGENFAQIFDRLMKKHGYRYSNTGRLTSGFYLESIEQADTGRLNIPACIQKMPGTKNFDGTTVAPPSNAKNTGNDDRPALGEFAYSDQSGWYFFANNKAPNIAFSGVTAKNGDVFRVQFTVYGLGADLGAGDQSIALKLPNRDEATKKLAAMKTQKQYKTNKEWQKAYKAAVKTVANLDSSLKQIKDAVSKIDALVKNTPDAATLKSVKKTGQSKTKLTWKKVNNCTGYEIYRSKKQSSGYTRIATVKGKAKTSYTTAKVKKGVTYYYKVRAYKKVGNQTYYGADSGVKRLKMK